MDEKAGSNVVEVGVDLSEFYMSVEWDILEVPAVRWDDAFICYNFVIKINQNTISHKKENSETLLI